MVVETDEAWSLKVADLAADRLLEAGLLMEDKLEAAIQLIAEEIGVRLALDARPGRHVCSKR